jgi:carboxyl-terminal processing protease
MISFRQTFFITLMVGLAVIGSFFAGYLFKEKQISSDELPVLVEARNLLLEYGLKDPPQNQRLEYGMIRGMLEAYGDPYTTFSEPVEHELATNNLEGSFGGIGIQLKRDEQNFHILIPLPDGPAIKIGILEGDRLARVDEMVITPETPVETIQAALRGKVGSQVVVTVERPPDYTLLEFTIERKEFSIPSVIGYLAPTESRLGILQVTIMAATTPKEIVECSQRFARTRCRSICTRPA